MTTGSQTLQMSHLVQPQPSDSGGDVASTCCTAGHGLVGSWQGLSSLSGEWVMVKGCSVTCEVWTLLGHLASPCSVGIKGSKNTLLSIPAWKVPSPPCSCPWVCFSDSWGWRQESTGSQAGRGNPACCCCWGGQRGANQPARMQAVELSLFAISCVSAAFPLTHSLPFPPTPRKHQVKVPAVQGCGSSRSEQDAVQGWGMSPCLCPWWVPVLGESVSLVSLSTAGSCPPAQSMKSWCPVLLPPALCKATSWHRQGSGLWQWICQWTGIWALAADL